MNNQPVRFLCQGTRNDGFGLFYEHAIGHGLSGKRTRTAHDALGNCVELLMRLAWPSDEQRFNVIHGVSPWQ
jgi:hypothetical protein